VYRTQCAGPGGAGPRACRAAAQPAPRPPKLQNLPRQPSQPSLLLRLPRACCPSGRHASGWGRSGTIDPGPAGIDGGHYLLFVEQAAEPLLYLDKDHQLKPWLAESWEVSPDAKVFTFKLRKDVTFQDGAPFNAQAAKWNFDRIVDPAFKAGSALNSLAGFDGCEVVDDYTIRVKFKNPFPPFLINAASGSLSFVSPLSTPKQGIEVNQKPVLTGPYRLTEYVPKDHATLERWDGYKRRSPWSDHDGPGYLDKITFKFIPEAGTRVTTLESGETQMVSPIPYGDLARLKGNKGIAIQTTAWPGAPTMWFLNVTLAPTNDLKVRQAINLGLDRNGFLNTIYKDVGVYPSGPLTAALLNDPSLPKYVYDPDKAKQLLAEAGWEQGGQRRHPHQ